MIYHLVVNAKNLEEKKNAKKLESVKAVFESANKELVVHPTQYAGHAKEIVAEITANGEETCVIAMGGDGTLHEVINGIADASKCSLGLIPMGTGNDFGSYVGISSDPTIAARAIANKEPEYIDYIELSSGVRSINSVGTGIDVDVLKATYAGTNKKRNKYLVSLIKTLFTYKSKNFSVIYDGVEEKHHGLIACLANGGQFGGGIKICPQAKINDGYLDLVIVDYLSFFKTIGAFMKLMSGKFSNNKEVSMVRCKEAKFVPIDENFTIQAEGELYDYDAFDAKIVSNKLKFYLPDND